MDDVVSLPEFLVTRLDPDSRESHQSEIAHFVPDLQCAPACPSFSGVRVFPNFLTSDEAGSMLREIEKSAFTKAQSGKLKQHYGPKINFNKKKMNANQFRGLPAYAWIIEDRFRKRAQADLESHATADQTEFLRALESFETTDLFVLRYFEQDSSNLDFHVDDLFAHGELILDLSLESDSALTFLDHEGETPRCVRLPLPARSLVAIFGKARLKWEHAILARDIKGQRTSVTSRTLHRNLHDSAEGRHVLEMSRRGSR